MSHQPCSRFHRDTLPVDATWFRLRDAVCRNLLICGASQERRNELGVSRRPARVGKAKGFARKVPTSHPLRWDQIMAFLDQYFGPRIAYLDFLVHTEPQEQETVRLGVQSAAAVKCNPGSEISRSLKRTYRPKFTKVRAASDVCLRETTYLLGGRRRVEIDGHSWIDAAQAQRADTRCCDVEMDNSKKRGADGHGRKARSVTVCVVATKLQEFMHLDPLSPEATVQRRENDGRHHGDEREHGKQRETGRGPTAEKVLEVVQGYFTIGKRSMRIVERSPCCQAKWDSGVKVQKIKERVITPANSERIAGFAAIAHAQDTAGIRQLDRGHLPSNTRARLALRVSYLRARLKGWTSRRLAMERASSLGLWRWPTCAGMQVPTGSSRSRDHFAQSQTPEIVLHGAAEQLKHLCPVLRRRDFAVQAGCVRNSPKR
ncbi:hypothetical protein DFH06DRAFT_1145234 [Mycena polygramma]|nr:hypothetical protein DFH06DRAFT_1145234 [Mycena polygramma]